MFQNINPLAKSTAITEILIMLLVAAIIGYLLGLLYPWFVCKCAKEEKKVEPKIEAKPEPVKVSAAPVAAPSQQDDLKKIEGIGPAIEKLLHTNGVFTFAQLAETPLNRIKDIIATGGPQFQMHGGETWAEQAILARDGKWEEFDKLTKELVNGKRV